MNDIFSMLRCDYHTEPLAADDLPAQPFEGFRHWFMMAVEKETIEPNAMALATAGKDGSPSVRMVLLKELDDLGFVFFTNYESRKGRHIEENPRASLVFYWPLSHRQVRVEGFVEKLTELESDTYFAKRPRGAQIGAWTSQQSRPVVSRAEMERLRRQTEERFAGTTVPRPVFWGGYRLIPCEFEFWQGREDRFHDRIHFLRLEEGWRRERLMP